MRITGLKSAFENIPTSCKVSAAGVITSINGNPFLEKCCLLLTRTLWHLSFDVSTAKLTTSHQKSQNSQSVPVFAKQAGDKTETSSIDNLGFLGCCPRQIPTSLSEIQFSLSKSISAVCAIPFPHTTFESLYQNFSRISFISF